MLWWFVLVIPALLLSHGNLGLGVLIMGYPSLSFTWCRSDGTRTGDAGHAVVRVVIGGRCSFGGIGCARNAAGSRGTAGGVRRHSIRQTRHGLNGRPPKPKSALGRPPLDPRTLGLLLEGLEGGQAERVPGRVGVDAAVVVWLEVVLRGTGG